MTLNLLNVKYSYDSKASALLTEEGSTEAYRYAHRCNPQSASLLAADPVVCFADCVK